MPFYKKIFAVVRPPHSPDITTPDFFWCRLKSKVYANKQLKQATGISLKISDNVMKNLFRRDHFDNRGGYLSPCIIVEINRNYSIKNYITNRL